jgi:hypothetical protein
MISPNMWTDERFGEWSFETQSLWVCILTKLADQQGRLRENLALIRSDWVPFKDIDVSTVAACLDEIGDRLIRYEVDGKKYIQVRNWWSYYTNQYAVPSNFPAPENWKDRFRTNYKKRYIVFNWPGQEDNELGSLLWQTLSTLPRISSWTIYVDTPLSVPVSVSIPVSKKKETPPLPDPDFPLGDDQPAGEFAPYEQVFIEETKLPLFSGGPQRWFEGLKEIHAAGATPEDFRLAIREQMAAGKRNGKNYNATSPASFVTATLNVVARRNAQPPPAPDPQAEALAAAQRKLYGDS